MRISHLISPFIYAKVKGWKQTVLYILTIALSSSAAYMYFDEEIYSQYIRNQKKLTAMEKELLKKQEVSKDFKTLQVILNETQGNKTSCIDTLKKTLSNSADNKQWTDCVGKESVIQRMDEFRKKNQSFLVTFKTPQAVLESLAEATREVGVNNVKYKITSLTNNDRTEAIPLTLYATIQPEILFVYMEKLGTYCKSCLIKINTLQYDQNTREFDAIFKVSLYLDAGKESKTWQQAISMGELSGNDLASYKGASSTNR